MMQLRVIVLQMLSFPLSPSPELSWHRTALLPLSNALSYTALRYIGTSGLQAVAFYCAFGLTAAVVGAVAWLLAAIVRQREPDEWILRVRERLSLV